MESDDDLPQNATATPSTSTYYPDFSRKLVCVQYPAVVNNVDRAIETLGGKSTLEAVVGNSNRKLELRFHPKNIYCKPCIADRDYKPGVLLKVKIRRPKVNTKEEAGPSRAPAASKTTVTGYEVVGVTAMNFQFNRLCDFQYLPLVPAEGEHEEKETPLIYVHDGILADKLPDKNWLFSNESISMPCFLPPSVFSRYNNSDNKLEFDKIDVYNSTMRPEIGEQLIQYERRSEARKAKILENENVSQRASMIHNSRRSRKAFSSIVNYNEAEVPSEPSERVLSLLRLDIVKDAPIERIKKLFEERPIWSKVAIAYKTGIPFRLLKFILPSVAYYFIGGPWRVMWVRYGYDPRKEPSSRIYQTFDFRVRDVDASILSSKSGISSVRAPKAVKKFSLKDNIQKRNANSPEIKEHYFILKPDVIPYGRQTFYQFCDVQLPEVQNMLARLPEIAAGQTCDPKTGWLPDHFQDQCREIANKYVQQKAKKMFTEERERGRSIKTVDECDAAGDKQDGAEESRIVIEDESDTEIREEQEGDEDDEGDLIEHAEEWNMDEEDDDDEEAPAIDLDAVEEVNQLLQSSTNPKQEEPDIDTKTIQMFAEFLKD